MVPAPDPGHKAPPVADNGCGTIGLQRSTDGGGPATVTFINGTDAYRAILWIDHNGIPQMYAGLNPGESYVQSTVVGHPWMISDGPGNCIGVYLPPAGQSFFSITATGYFGPE